MNTFESISRVLANYIYIPSNYSILIDLDDSNSILN